MSTSLLYHAFRIRGYKYSRFRSANVGRGQKLSHYRGQIESPASLPGGVTVGFSGK
jgi:hypothetical protein